MTISETSLDSQRGAGAVVQHRLASRGRRQLLRFSAFGWWLVDALIASCAVVFAFAWLTPVVTSDRHVGLLGCGLLYAILLPVVAHVAGLHDSRYPRHWRTLAWRSAGSVIIALICVVLELWLIHYFRIGRSVLLAIGALSCPAMVLTRLGVGMIDQRHAPVVCLYGSADFAKHALAIISSHGMPFTVCTSRDHMAKEGSRFDDWVLDRGVDEIVVDSNSASPDDLMLLRCLGAGVTVSSFAEFIEQHYFFVPVEQIDAGWLFSARLDLARPYYNGIKRLIDIAAALIGLVLTAPLMIVAMAIIKFEGPGPAIYSQIRVGRFNRLFRIYKLRSMVQNAEESGAKWAELGDSRVTRFGRLIRKTRIDELPQLWNILIGDMSLIGPRPERPEFVETLADAIPFYQQRHLVKPGLTGWAQINYPYGASIEDSLSKLTYDLFYVKRSSFTVDMQVVLRTIGAISKGAR